MRTEATAGISFVKNLMEGKMNAVNGDGVAYVDMHSTATAHVRAITVPEAANRRFILVKETPTFIQYAQPIIDKYQPLGWPINPTKNPKPEGAVLSLFDNTASREVLGIEYLELND